jgi:xylan 1,4-beta-xylosidase
VDVLASRSSGDGRVAVLVWRHADDQYATDEATTPVELQVDGLAPGRWSVAHRRIDRGHSNSHTVWQDLGAPQDPTPEQLATIRDRQGLERFADDLVETVGDGGLALRLELLLPSLSLIVITPAGEVA